MGLLSKLPVIDSDVQGWPWTEETDEKIYDPSILWPKISIVTPSYNQGIFIEETIRSVLLQNYPNLEYIIIDGGSTDKTREVIKHYEPWITYWISEADRGQSHAINKGLEKSAGEIFNWLNSDDSYLPDTFFQVVSTFINDPTAQIVSGYEYHITLDGESVLHSGTLLKQSIEETIERCEVAQPSTFFRLSSIKQIGGISEDLHYIMDGEMWVKLLLLYGQKGFLKIKKPLVNFRLHKDSKTVTNAIVNNFLFERSSILADLQQFLQVPSPIISYYLSDVYRSPQVYTLSRSWQINGNIVREKKLKTYFIKKYVTIQFRNKSRRLAFWGLQQLVKNGSFDFFLLKGFLKLIVKKL